MPNPAKRQTDLRPPGHLKPATRRWWASVCGDWLLEEHHRRLLTLACESWDRSQQARALVEAEGMTTATARGGSRVHPAIRVEQDSKLLFARLIRELDLDVTPPAESRPPMLRSIATR